MSKSQTDYFSDDLMADALQAENYLRQSHSCPLQTIQRGIEQGLQSYLERYQLASPRLKFQIFLFSNFYGEKTKYLLEEDRGEFHV
ncbi:TPA: hypothetical protein VBX43_000917 [Streptococcus agalactiae]|nr:hypothetical protein [Streptococcus agalactiae]